MHAQPSSHDPLQRRVLQAVMAGMAAVVLLPFAQADTASFGWLPLWLVGLPIASWMALSGVRRLEAHADAGPAQPAALSAEAVARARRRRSGAQARRRVAARMPALPQRARPTA